MEIRPFRGWRYRVAPGGDVGPYIAPPYDVLGEADKRALLDRCAENIVAVDLPQWPPRQPGADMLYGQAADLLRQWQASGVLVQESKPALYVYEQTFHRTGRRYDRLALLCGVRATELGRDVIPHEHTYPGPKADRLKLTEHTRMQLSPVFGFYDDAGSGVLELLRSACARPPDAQGWLGEVHEKLWVLADGGTIGRVAAALADRPAFIADGHHRYTTALNYRDALLRAGAIDADHEANFVLFALVARSDPGLLILPTHRLFRGLREGGSVAQLREGAPEFEWRRLDADEVDLADADAFLRRFGPGAMAVLDSSPAEVWIARLTDPDAMARAAADKPAAWRALDVAVLHELLVGRALAPWRTEQTSIEYTPDGRAVLAAVHSGKAQLGVCLQATPLSAVEAVARGGQSMPHKSTYFHPKLATGMVLKPLA